MLCPAGGLGRRRGKRNLFVPLASFLKWLTLTGWSLLFVEQWLLEKRRGSQFSPCVSRQCMEKALSSFISARDWGCLFSQGWIHSSFSSSFSFPYWEIQHCLWYPRSLHPLLAKIRNGRTLTPAWGLSWCTQVEEAVFQESFSYLLVCFQKEKEENRNS